jgi:predicted metal-binding membrane protein
MHCVCCCAGSTAVLLAVGVMDLRAMAIIAAVVALERLAPGGHRVARAIGAAAMAIGSIWIAQAAGIAWLA